jgi:hypothetical protein
MWVIVRGGLGNQMFQAAFAISVSRRFAVTPRFVDLTSIAAVPRRWELGCFGITPTPVDDFTRFRLVAISYASQKLNRSGLHGWPGVLSDNNCRLCTGELTRAPRMIVGYWQSEGFFAEYAETIRELFSMPDLSAFASTPDPVDDCPSVAIHVRRGDYVSNPVASRTHLVCDAEWYRRAWRAIRLEHPRARAMVFSDDADWTRTNLDLDGAIEYMDGVPDTEPWVDLARMSQCQHFIISNSSFSWWAAWLGRDPQKRVIAPREWFAGRATAELGIAPEAWTLL